MQNANKINRPLQANESSKKSWVVLKEGSDTIVIWRRPLATGVFQDSRYVVALRIVYNGEIIEPRLLIRIHAQNVEELSSDAAIGFDDSNVKSEMSILHTVITYSIIHQDYESVFTFRLDEADLIKLFKSEEQLYIDFKESSLSIKFDKDESLQYVLLKEKIAPSLLSEEQTSYLSEEREKFRQQQERKREEAAALKLKRNNLIHDLALSLAKGLIEAKDKQRSSSDCAFSRLRMSSFIDDNVINKLGLRKLEKPGEGICFEGQDLCISIGEIINYLKRKNILSKKGRDADSLYVDHRMSLQEAEGLLNNEIVYSELLNKWNTQVKIEKQRQLEEQNKALIIKYKVIFN